ncbi:DNA ligase D [Oxalicibacterium solurbis]|uniref:DNA ligase (ATP) n=1 Tax=Oxalicibacterium solurbis TaxID=69280 RepID=A0A8J3AVD2_9BURK|nr:DNA ligase D [Oxalicibacterium solurbis]GGI52916.1 ATP-dependent DNA ligase [Oxalicibacterium solurbis]
MPRSDTLKTYKTKRNFRITSEPSEGGVPNAEALSFVVQKHWASRLHYDFRLELDGTMKSWAVPKGPSYDTHDKRMAVHVEDHPIAYNKFEGQIPEKQYGAGKVIIWDKGIWTPLTDPHDGFRKGSLKFELHGHKLHGRWALVRMKGGRYGSGKQEPWLLIKERDEYARPATEFSVIDELPDSVARLSDPSDANTAKSAKTAKASRPAAKSVALAKTTARKTASRGSNRNIAIAGAMAADLPKTLTPQLATLVDKPPQADDSGDWLYEIKFDGYRIVARIDGSGVRLVTRNGNDWTDKLPALAAELRKLKLKPCWLDGEIVVADENGVPNFQMLQNAFDTAKTRQIAYYVFDLPFHDGLDLRKAALQDRRALLQQILAKKSSDFVRYSDTFDVPANEIVASACRLGLEGVIGKRRDSHYVSRRSPDWIKLKCGRRQEFVIGGYTDPQGTRKGFGSLLLGVHDDKGHLRYAGNVGSGFNDKTLQDLKDKLDALATDKSPFTGGTGPRTKAHWIKPKLVAEIAFSEWTDGGHVRQAVFHGLRTDKKANTIVHEEPVAVGRIAKSASSGKGGSTKGKSKDSSKDISKGKRASQTDAAMHSTLPTGFKVTHPDRVIDPSTGITKIDLIRYYALVAPLMMPHLKGRPTSLVRAPDGIKSQLFFQKHMDEPMDGTRLLDPALDPDHASLIEIASPLGLMTAAQWNVIEFHTWNGVKTAIDKPDRMTFDLDPGEGVAWPVVLEATLLMRSFLEQLGLASFVKTSGGKGMHVIVPLKKRYDWDTVKDFSKAIVEHMAQTLPQRFVAKSGPKNRVGKIFIDYLRNGFGATTVAAWSVRARPGLGVSVPVGWDEVEKLHGSAQWHVANIHTRLDQGNTPWDGYDAAAQNITAAMKMLGFTRGKK